MIGPFILIVIGIIFFILGFFFWDTYDFFDAAPLSWIIGLLMIAFGIISFFNHDIFNVVFHNLTALLHYKG